MNLYREQIIPPLSQTFNIQGEFDINQISGRQKD
jgi:hypothetical protein